MAARDPSSGRFVSSGSVRAGGAFVEIGGTMGPLDAVLGSASKKLDAFGTKIATLGAKMVALGAAIGAPMVAGLKVASDFGDEMAFVSTMLTESDMSKFMPDFTNQVRDLSVAFGESTDTISRGLFDILSASIDASQAAGVLVVSMKAAQAGFTTTAVSADAITTILNSYGLNANEAASVSDFLFAVVKRGKTTFEELGPAIGMVASTAASAGISLEEMGAALSTMTRNGVRTNVAVTALNAIIATFLSPQEQAITAAKRFGIQLNTTTLKTIGLEGVLKKLSKATTEQVSAVFRNRRAIRGILPMLNDMKGFTKDVGIQMDRAGSTEEAFEKRTKTLAFAVRQLRQSFVDLLRQIGINLEEDVRKAVVRVTSFVRGITKWIGENKELVRRLADTVKWVVLIGASLIVLGGILKAVAVFLSPGGILGVALGLFMLWSGALDDIVDRWNGFIMNIRIGTLTVRQLLTRIGLIWEDIKLTWSAGMDLLVTSFRIMGLRIADLWNMMLIGLTVTLRDMMIKIAQALVKFGGGQGEIMALKLGKAIKGVDDEVGKLTNNWLSGMVKIRDATAKQALLFEDLKDLLAILKREFVDLGLDLVPTLPGLRELIARLELTIPDVALAGDMPMLGLPEDVGDTVVGTFSGAAAELQRATDRIQMDQLDVMEDSNGKLADIVKNTSRGNIAVLG